MIEERIERTESEVGKYRLTAESQEQGIRPHLVLNFYRMGLGAEKIIKFDLAWRFGLKPAERVRDQREKWLLMRRSLLSANEYLVKPLERIADDEQRQIAYNSGIVLPFQTVQQLLESCLEPYIQRARRIEEALKIR